MASHAEKLMKKILTAVAAGLAAVTISAGAWSQPAPVTPGANNVTIPTFSGPVPTFKVLGSTGEQMETIMVGGSPVAVTFDEFALTTSLNPAGVTFAFAISTSNNPTSLGASLTGFSLPTSFGALTTSVQGCNPFIASATVCGMATGLASRSSGLGDTLTFSSLGTTAVTIGPITTNLTNPVAIFTNAPSFTDPSVNVTDDGATAVFTGLGPAGGSTSVPEPTTLALMGLGLLGTALVQRRRRSLKSA
jgi:hypothetical protein